MINVTEQAFASFVPGAGIACGHRLLLLREKALRWLVSLLPLHKDNKMEATDGWTLKSFTLPRSLLIKFWFERHSLELAIGGTLLALFMLLGFMTWLYMTAPDTVALRKEYNAWMEQVKKENSTDAGKRAWQRLNRKHGNPRVVYEMGQPPYYVNKAGQKCRFI
jgi:hypothetical protein